MAKAKLNRFVSLMVVIVMLMLQIVPASAATKEDSKTLADGSYKMDIKCLADYYDGPSMAGDYFNSKDVSVEIIDGNYYVTLYYRDARNDIQGIYHRFNDEEVHYETEYIKTKDIYRVVIHADNINEIYMGVFVPAMGYWPEFRIVQVDNTLEKTSENRMFKEAKKVSKKMDKKINSLGKVSLDKKEKILDLEKEYNELNQYEKVLVKEKEKLDKALKTLDELIKDAHYSEEAKRVDELILGISKSDDKYNAVVDVVGNYEALDDDAKAKVKELKVLEAEENKLEELKDKAVALGKDYANAIRFDKDAEKLGDIEATQESIYKTNNLRQKYTSLSDYAKSRVTKLEILEAAEGKLVDFHILNIGNFNSDYDKWNATLHARAAYNELLYSSMRRVSKLDYLEEKEAEIVDSDISNLPKKTSLSTGRMLNEVKKTYNSLKPGAKDKMKNIKKLNDIEEEFINIINNEVKNSGNIDDVVKAYGWLDDESKKKIDQEALSQFKIENAEARIDKIKDIENLTSENEADIESAIEAIEYMLPEEVAKVKNIEAFNDLKDRFNEFVNDYTAAIQGKNFEDRIIQFKGITMHTLKEFDYLLEEYSNLSADAKAYVNPFLFSRIKALQRQHDEYVENLHAIVNIEKKINSIGEIDSNSNTIINEIITDYNNLEGKYRGDIRNIDLLIKADDSYSEFMKNEEKAAQDVTEKINSIGEVSLESKEKILAAREAYDELSEYAKTKIENLNILEEAELVFNKLEAEKAEEDAKKDEEDAKKDEASKDEIKDDNKNDVESKEVKDSSEAEGTDVKTGDVNNMAVVLAVMISAAGATIACKRRKN